MAKEIPKPEGWGELDPNIANTSPRDLPSHYSRAPPIAIERPRGALNKAAPFWHHLHHHIYLTFPGSLEDLLIRRSLYADTKAQLQLVTGIPLRYLPFTHHEPFASHLLQSRLKLAGSLGFVGPHDQRRRPVLSSHHHPRD